MSTGSGRSVRRKTIPESGGAGRRVMRTFLPVCKPTPVARMEFFRVLCPTIFLLLVSNCMAAGGTVLQAYSTVPGAQKERVTVSQAKKRHQCVPAHFHTPANHFGGAKVPTFDHRPGPSWTNQASVSL